MDASRIIQQKLTGPRGIVLEIDSTDEATPAMVYSNDRRHSSTYDCATGTGFIDDAIELADDQMRWLDGHSELVAEAFNLARAGNPDYQ